MESLTDKTLLEVAARLGFLAVQSQACLLSSKLHCVLQGFLPGKYVYKLQPECVPNVTVPTRWLQLQEHGVLLSQGASGSVFWAWLQRELKTSFTNSCHCRKILCFQYSMLEERLCWRRRFEMNFCQNIIDMHFLYFIVFLCAQWLPCMPFQPFSNPEVCFPFHRMAGPRLSRELDGRAGI